MTIADFQAALLTQHKSLMKSLLAPVFRHMDKSGSGKVTAEDMARVFHDMGQARNRRVPRYPGKIRDGADIGD